MPKIIFLPIFEEENERCFCVNQSVMNLLRTDSEEEMILYFSKSFWDKYPKPFGMEKMFEIIQNIKVPIKYIGIVSDWKYLDKYARTHDLDAVIPSNFEQLINEHKCISLLIDEQLESSVSESEGWGIFNYIDIYNTTNAKQEKFYLDPLLEEKIISIEMMNANEKLVRFYDHNLGNINISMN